MNYQSGTDNLVDSYYGIDTSRFLPEEICKRFLKNS